MILRAQDEGAGLGGHIATYASAATAMETAFHHIFSAEDVAIWCFPSPMLHRVSMPVLISRGGSASSSCATSAGSWEREGFAFIPSPTLDAGILAGA